jgi:hypothetical protein
MTRGLEGRRSIQLSYGRRIRNRGARIRTGDLLLPKQARYRTAPRPVGSRRILIGSLGGSTPVGGGRMAEREGWGDGCERIRFRAARTVRLVQRGQGGGERAERAGAVAGRFFSAGPSRRRRGRCRVEEERVVAEAVRCRAGRRGWSRRRCRWRESGGRRAGAARRRRCSGRRGGRRHVVRARGAGARCWRGRGRAVEVGRPANRRERTPGAPPSASTQMPESSAMVGMPVRCRKKAALAWALARNVSKASMSSSSGRGDAGVVERDDAAEGGSEDLADLAGLVALRVARGWPGQRPMASRWQLEQLADAVEADASSSCSSSG